jgi:TetR/AcrR family tetracycline transcriptional repressor
MGNLEVPSGADRGGAELDCPTATAAGLSQQDLVAATSELIRQQGVRGLSMRVLAGQLGVTATAIYYHVRNKQQLLELTADVIVSQIRVGEPVKDWREELRLLLLKQQSVLREYPGIGRFLFDHRGSEASVRWMNTFLELLLRAGFDDAGAVVAFGRISSHINPLFLVGDLVQDEARGPAQQGVAGLLERHPEKYPAVAKVLPYLAPMSFDDVYTAGVDSLVASLAADLRAQRRQGKR